MLMLLIFVLVLFRWPILSRFIGIKRMHLFDAVMFTAFAAQQLAAAHLNAFDGLSVLNLAVMGLCIWWARSAARRFLTFDELAKAAQNGQGNSDGGTASPS